MAQVAQDPQLQARIDRYLEYLRPDWHSIHALAAEWDEWDDLDQLVFVVEWPMREDKLHQLGVWFEQGLFTPEQRARYEGLLRLIARHRATLEYLISDESMRKPTAETVGHAPGAHES